MTVPDTPQAQGLIELRLDDSRQLFNSLDPTPFAGRDLDRDAQRFILEWARELPGRSPFIIRLHLASLAPGDRELVPAAIRNNFGALAEGEAMQLRRLLTNGRRTLAIGLTFLAFCLWSADWLGNLPNLPRLLVVLKESLVIGGWVALWRPLEIFLYDWWPILGERRLCQRLAAARVEINGSLAGD